MNAPSVRVRLSNSWLFLLAVLSAAIIAIVLLESPQMANGETAMVTYSRGSLHVTTPYHALHSGDGKLSVEVLDPEDKILAEHQREHQRRAARSIFLRGDVGHRFTRGAGRASPIPISAKPSSILRLYPLPGV